MCNHAERVGRQPHVDDVKQVEEFRPELKVHALGAAGAAPEWRVLDEREVVVVVSRPAEAVTAERAEAALVRAGAATDKHRDAEVVGAISAAVSEIVFAVFARRRKVRLSGLVRTIDPVRSCSGLLNTGVDREGRSGINARHDEHLPAVGNQLRNGVEEIDAGKVEILCSADRECMRDVKIRDPLFVMRVQGILRKTRYHGAGIPRTTQNETRGIDGFTPRVSGLNSRTAVPDVA